MSDVYQSAKALHEAEPSASSVAIGKQLLQQYPGTPSNEMFSALSFAGFTAEQSQNAVSELYDTAVTVDVNAKGSEYQNQLWLDTGFLVETGAQLTIKYLGGQWTANPATGMVDANGNSAYIAKPGYSLPGANEGALIGRIGESGAPFLVGNSYSGQASATGNLCLIINDDIPPRYGDGFVDNEGSVLVQINEGKTA